MGVSGLYTQQVGWMRAERPALSPPAPQEPVTGVGVVVVYMGQSQIPLPIGGSLPVKVGWCGEGV